MRPVFDSSGTLRGYRSICTVDQPPLGQPLPPPFPAPLQEALNDAHYNPFDPPLPHKAHRLRHRARFAHKRSLMGGIFGPDPPNTLASTQFNWMSPTVEGLNAAHRAHRRCVRERRKWLNERFALHNSMDDSLWPHHHHLNPYDSLPGHQHCLPRDHYDSEPDYYGLHLMHQIHDGHDLHAQLHRHLDCHCHHRLADSQRFGIHHHPLPQLNADVYAHDGTMLHGDLDADVAELDANRMTLLRMANGAMSHARTQGLLGTTMAQMDMFHPALQSGDWNQPQVEKVIVIKRLKVPIVMEKRIPQPYPVPVPVYAGDASKAFPTQIVQSSQSTNNAMAMVPSGQQVAQNTFLVDGGDGLQTRHILEQATGMEMPSPCEMMGNSMPGGMMMGNPMMPGMNSMMGNSMMNPMMSNPMNNPMMSGMNPMMSNPMMTSMQSQMMNPMMSNPMMNSMQSQMINPMMSNPMSNQMIPGMNPMMQGPYPQYSQYSQPYPSQYSYSTPYDDDGPGLQLHPHPPPAHVLAHHPVHHLHGHSHHDNSFAGKVKKHFKTRLALRAIGMLTKGVPQMQGIANQLNGGASAPQAADASAPQAASAPQVASTQQAASTPQVASAPATTDQGQQTQQPASPQSTEPSSSQPAQPADQQAQQSTTS